MKKLTIKNSFLLLFIIIFSSCTNNEQKLLNQKEILEKEIDSLTDLITKTENNVGLNLLDLIKRETQTDNDSTLLPEYKSLLGKNDIIDIYIWDRIQTISNQNNYNEIVSEFNGKYRLKPNHNDKYVSVNSIKIENDSCFLYKNKELIVSEKLKIRNSTNEFTKGKLFIKNYRITLHSSGFGKLIFINDNGCMDCEQLQFYKTE